MRGLQPGRRRCRGWRRRLRFEIDGVPLANPLEHRSGPGDCFSLNVVAGNPDGIRPGLRTSAVVDGIPLVVKPLSPGEHELRIVVTLPQGAREILYLLDVESPDFLRADCNGDGTVIGAVDDAVFTLQYNFTGGPTPPCIAACDADGDGMVAGVVTDAIYTLTFNFLGGPAPVAPWPECGPGELPTDAELGCVTPPRDASDGRRGMSRLRRVVTHPWSPRLTLSASQRERPSDFGSGTRSGIHRPTCDRLEHSRHVVEAEEDVRPSRFVTRSTGRVADRERERRLRIASAECSKAWRGDLFVPMSLHLDGERLSILDENEIDFVATLRAPEAELHVRGEQRSKGQEYMALVNRVTSSRSSAARKSFRMLFCTPRS